MSPSIDLQDLRILVNEELILRKFSSKCEHNHLRRFESPEVIVCFCAYSSRIGLVLRKIS